MKREHWIVTALCILLLAGNACSEKPLPLETESLIVRCEDQRNADPLIELLKKIGDGERRIPSRLAIAAGRIGDFRLWRTVRDRFGSDPVVSDSLAGAVLFPGHNFPKEQLFDLLKPLPYTPILCQAMLSLAEPQSLRFVLDKKVYPDVIAENLWRSGSRVSDQQLRQSYSGHPYQTVYSSARLRRKGFVKSRDISGASPFTRCIGTTVCDNPSIFLHDPDWRVRTAALRVLEKGEAGRSLLSDENPLVVSEAYAALARFGLDLSTAEIDRMTPMQAALFLANQKDSSSVVMIYSRGGEFARLAAPFMPAEAREEILGGNLPLSAKLAYLMNQNPVEAIGTARTAFFEQESSQALQFLLENEKHENLTDVITMAKGKPEFVSVLIDNNLIKQPIPNRDDNWYRNALEKIRRYRGFTLICSEGIIRCRFEHEQAPLTVFNFIELAEKGYYDNTVFHRVVPAFVCQGGDPTGSGSGGPGYAIRCEYNTLHYDGAGVVGMALAGKDTGGSQFFLTHLATPHLDYNYTIFARVIAGISVLNRIEQYHRLEKIQLW